MTISTIIIVIVNSSYFYLNIGLAGQFISRESNGIRTI